MISRAKEESIAGRGETWGYTWVRETWTYLDLSGKQTDSTCRGKHYTIPRSLCFSTIECWWIQLFCEYVLFDRVCDPIVKLTLCELVGVNPCVNPGNQSVGWRVARFAMFLQDWNFSDHPLRWCLTVSSFMRVGWVGMLLLFIDCVATIHQTVRHS